MESCPNGATVSSTHISDGVSILCHLELGDRGDLGSADGGGVDGDLLPESATPGIAVPAGSS